NARNGFRRFPLLLLCEDLIAQRDTLVADVHRGSRDELLHRVLGLAAEGAAEMLFAGHRTLRVSEEHRSASRGSPPGGGENYRSCRRAWLRSEEHTSELQSRENLVCRLLLEKKKT